MLSARASGAAWYASFQYPNIMPPWRRWWWQEDSNTTDLIKKYIEIFPHSAQDWTTLSGRECAENLEVCLSVHDVQVAVGCNEEQWTSNPRALRCAKRFRLTEGEMSICRANLCFWKHKCHSVIGTSLASSGKSKRMLIFCGPHCMLTDKENSVKRSGI